MPKEKVLIGLEVHTYIKTNEKLFCRCSAKYKEKNIKPNTFICPICTGQPGCKPMLPNQEAIIKALKIALMLNFNINTIEKGKKLIWQRKHYDWPDLPKGYQDTMSGSYSIPLGENGNFLNITIREMHLEEDPAAWDPQSGCIDYNRSGVPLVEIVTEPEFTSADQVIHWLKQLLLTLSYIKAIDKDAGIKVDVNVSTTGERVEMKNLNSLYNIRQAINYEINRQRKEKTTKKETRRYDPVKNKTIKMREKEEAADYRFIPDPDLPVIRIQNKTITQLNKQLPESPQQKLTKMIKKYKIDKKNAEILTNNFELAEFFEKIAKKIPPSFALSWVTIELLRVLNYNKKNLEDVDIKPEHFIELLKLVKDKKITELKAKRILNDFIPSSFSPKTKIAQAGRITDKKQIEDFCRQVINKNKQAVVDFKSGKKQAFNFLMGEVMKLSNRRADYRLAMDVMKKLLK